MDGSTSDTPRQLLGFSKGGVVLNQVIVCPSRLQKFCRQPSKTTTCPLLMHVNSNLDNSSGASLHHQCLTTSQEQCFIQLSILTCWLMLFALLEHQPFLVELTRSALQRACESALAPAVGHVPASHRLNLILHCMTQLKCSMSTCRTHLHMHVHTIPLMSGRLQVLAELAEFASSQASGTPSKLSHNALLQPFIQVQHTGHIYCSPAESLYPKP